MSDQDENDIRFMLGQISGQLDAMNTSIAELKVIAEKGATTSHGHDLRISALEASRCPKPGACIEVGVAVADLAKDVRELQRAKEAAENQIKGARVLWIAICSLLSGLFAILGMKLLKLLGFSV